MGLQQLAGVFGQQQRGQYRLLDRLPRVVGQQPGPRVGEPVGHLGENVAALEAGVEQLQHAEHVLDSALGE
ncbi:hypothetical protein [Micromonospora rhizosphaerae]|uniref:hypothetical protein n=1 Tax=Micromonospora rhizosphaerae TaxID=568872 RepID=UPI000B886B33|nr:hypothetical protein [Micromonospora rhizosphaerae]